MTRKNKHMTDEDRMEIQDGLKNNLTFKEIAGKIEKDPSTVSKEVRLHSKEHTNSYTTTKEVCPLLLKPPYVCNGCQKKSYPSCHYVRRIYSARTAQKEYEQVRSESREGIPLNKAEFYETEKTISNAVRKGQHIYHAIMANNLPVSKSTVYRHISKGYYTISKLDLPRAVKFKPRKQKQQDYVPKAAKIGRTYDDFTAYMAENNLHDCSEMDTVIGRPGGKLIMTFIFTAFDFMFGILLEDKTAAEAASKIQAFKKQLETAGFKFGEIFPVLLTDNGGEFSCVSAFEYSPDGEPETRLFFCDPNSPYQKPHVENNHVLFRDIVPKGESFDSFTQDTVNLIFSHVNAIKREQFNSKSAYDLFTFAFSKELAKALGISFIPPTEVIQSPKLLR